MVFALTQTTVETAPVFLMVFIAVVVGIVMVLRPTRRWSWCHKRRWIVIIISAIEVSMVITIEINSTMAVRIPRWWMMVIRIVVIAIGWWLVI